MANRCRSTVFNPKSQQGQSCMHATSCLEEGRTRFQQRHQRHIALKKIKLMDIPAPPIPFHYQFQPQKWDYCFHAATKTSHFMPEPHFLLKWVTYPSISPETPASSTNINRLFPEINKTVIASCSYRKPKDLDRSAAMKGVCTYLKRRW